MIQRKNNLAVTVLLLLAMVIMSFMAGFILAQSGFQFVRTQSYVLPPPPDTQILASEVGPVIDETDFELDDYGEGNNCLDLAEQVKRDLEWKGINAYIIRIDFGTSVGHAIVGIPTEDEGWLFWDPQLDEWVNPRAGYFWDGNLIINMYYAEGYNWKLLDSLEVPNEKD